MFYTFLGLALVVDANSANSCLVAMLRISISDIEFARDFSLLIVACFTLLDTVLMEPLDFLSGALFGPSSTADVSISALVSSAATMAVSLVIFRLRVFLALLVPAMAQDVRSRPGEL